MISAAVMAHPSRKDLVGSLLDKLGDIVAVAWDQKNDEWDTARRAILAYDPWATHHLVLQDDAIICRDLIPGLERILGFIDPEVLSAYVGKPRPLPRIVSARMRVAISRSHSYLRMRGPLWGVAVLFRVSGIQEMVEWMDQNPVPRAYDARLTKYFRDVKKEECWYTVPSLVDHREDLPSLLGKKIPHRRAWEFLGEEVSAFEVDWSRLPPDDLPMILEEGNWWTCLECGYRMASFARAEAHERQHRKIQGSREGSRR